MELEFGNTARSLRFFSDDGNMETRRGGKHWARKENSRSSRKNRIDACIRIYGDEYESRGQKREMIRYGSGDLPYKGRSGK